MMDLQDLRKEIDAIDDALVSLFVQRMEIAARIGDYKKEHGLPIFVPGREAEKLADVSQKAGQAMERYVQTLYSSIFELSRSYQQARKKPDDGCTREVTE